MKKIGTLFLAGTFLAAAALPVTAFAGPGSGRMSGQGGSARMQGQSPQQFRDQQRLRDGSCLDPARSGAATMQQKGNTYGPGDGTGNSGSGPKDGTGYGSPSQR